MSHFVVFVVVPDGANSEEHIATALKPFDENKRVPGYDSACYCVGNAARLKIRETLAEHPEIGRDAQQKERKRAEEKVKLKFPDAGPFDDDADRMFQEIIAPFVERRNRWMAERERDAGPALDAPLENCEECKGTGVSRTTYNPRSKWDWYSIGGRWDGIFSEIGLEGQNCVSVATLLPVLREYVVTHKSERNPFPFAFVGHDGQWHERGGMGWWGMVREEKQDDVWHRQVLAALEKAPRNAWVWAVDCHI